MLPRPPFNPQILLKKPTRPDPWARAETWRYTGPFTRWNRFKGAFPGLGIATVAFAAYCTWEAVFVEKDKHHGGRHSVVEGGAGGVGAA